MSRLSDLRRFYGILEGLERRVGGKQTLATCSGRMDWPKRGIYFFFEPGEQRSESGPGPRVVRVGTHALKQGSRTTLWNRLSQHRGVQRTGGGNHRGSIFRLLVGEAIQRRDHMDVGSWGMDSDPGKAARRLQIAVDDVKRQERWIEEEVSAWIRGMPFLWVNVDDESGPDSDRGMIERSCIALLSNFASEPLDAASANWLGQHSARERVRRSGLWNNNHVDEEPDLQALDLLEHWAARTTPVGE